jgi:hypothetical protein
VIVTIMLIPQSLAYALLAGLPPKAGIYASIAPIILYAIFGTSRALAVGPVAVVSLMTAAAMGNIAEPGARATLAALTLAFLSGAFLILSGSAAGLSRQFPLPPGDRRLHHRLGHPHRHEPAAHVLGIEAAAIPAGDAAVPVRAPGRDQPGSRWPSV